MDELCDVIADRATRRLHFGTIVLPEGLLGHLPEMRALLHEMGTLYAQGVRTESQLRSQLKPWSAALFSSLPPFIRAQLTLERESQGGLQWSQVETERLLAHLCKLNLEARKAAKTYSGKFSAITSFFGYQVVVAGVSGSVVSLNNVAVRM